MAENAIGHPIFLPTGQHNSPSETFHGVPSALFAEVAVYFWCTIAAIIYNWSVTSRKVVNADKWQMLCTQNQKYVITEASFFRAKVVRIREMETFAQAAAVSWWGPAGRVPAYAVARSYTDGPRSCGIEAPFGGFRTCCQQHIVADCNREIKSASESSSQTRPDVLRSAESAAA